MIRFIWRAGSPKRRLRVRRVDEVALAAKVREQATTSGQLTAEITHGDTVCNSYGYKADTEAALAISDGRMTVVFMSRVPANKTTRCGAANACIPGSGFVWHGGRLNEGYVTASWSVIRLAFESAFTPLELLAACADA